MTREQIEAWRLLLDHHNAGDLCDLAERALVLEDVLASNGYFRATANEIRREMTAAQDEPGWPTRCTVCGELTAQVGGTRCDKHTLIGGPQQHEPGGKGE